MPSVSISSCRKDEASRLSGPYERESFTWASLLGLSGSHLRKCRATNSAIHRGLIEKETKDQGSHSTSSCVVTFYTGNTSLDHCKICKINISGLGQWNALEDHLRTAHLVECLSYMCRECRVQPSDKLKKQDVPSLAGESLTQKNNVLLDGRAENPDLAHNVVLSRQSTPLAASARSHRSPSCTSAVRADDTNSQTGSRTKIIPGHDRNWINALSQSLVLDAIPEEDETEAAISLVEEADDAPGMNANNSTALIDEVSRDFTTNLSGVNVHCLSHESSSYTEHAEKPPSISAIFTPKFAYETINDSLKTKSLHPRYKAFLEK
ncbi:hypothetical protein ACOME3_010691 [Neoechinorhynchus agilis]